MFCDDVTVERFTTTEWVVVETRMFCFDDRDGIVSMTSDLPL